MAITMNNQALAEAFGPSEGTALRIKQAVLVILGIAMLTIAAKIKVPMFPSPVPITLGTFAVLTIGASYGPRLGLATIFGYMLIGALGFDVFASSSADKNGLEYMMGGTGGYLVGYVLAVLYLGWAARRGMDRTIEGMAGALLMANVLIYVPGVFWLHQFTSGWEQTMEWGLTPYVIGDLMKLALAALLIPAVWKLVGKARG
ncbi:biotin transporter BioY [Octadecabacter ascidiaceicola]|uniref:Biotin transporter n=1 Tax=Octadecabacter ascidiaceicola TaxID=1655543 RepID=A0A238JQW3_9RHOB|nr:biotin transporter BioY [Octadecabacter ascidiaceicola]SMX32252.1 Biotin transporter BioY [Octadecabacter ascidiaceicola]